MKKFISIILSIAIVLSLFSVICVSAESETLTLKYDDRYVFEGKTVKSVTNSNVTSYKVGYGIDEKSALDDAVAVIDSENSSKIIATGVGTATVTFNDNSSVELTVEPADLSMFYLLGQSNAEGIDGDFGQSMVNEDGTVYSTYAPNNAWSGGKLTGYEHTDGLSLETAPSFVTASLTGTTNVLGNELVYAPNGLCDSGNGKAGLDSAIAYQWHKITGEKTWIVNAAHSGTSITQWNPESETENEFTQAKEVIKYAKQTAEREYNAGHYNIKHVAYIWMQGESDPFMSAQEYTDRYDALHKAFKDAMTMTVGNKQMTTEYGALIQVRYAYKTPMYTYNDIQLVGQRIAHYYLANEPQFSDIIMVSNVGDDWVKTLSSSETGKLKKYFKEHYPNGVLDYPTQNGTPNTIPTTCEQIHYGYHFSQVGYNEIGMDTSNSLAKAYGYITDANEAKLKVLKYNGFEEYGDKAYFEVGTEFTAVPVIDHVAYTASKEFKVELSGDVTEIEPYKYKLNGKSGAITYTLPGGKTQTITIESVKYGDLNDDGKVNLLDLILIRKYLAKWSVTINEEAADMMNNGKINLVDLTYLRKYLAKWAITLGPNDIQ